MENKDSGVKSKEEALKALAATINQRPEKEEEAYEDLLISLEQKAIRLGATGYDITHAHFEGTSEEERQGLFEIHLEEALELPIDEAIQFLKDGKQIMQDFNLKDPNERSSK